MKELQIYIRVRCTEDHARMDVSLEELYNLSKSWLVHLALRITSRHIIRAYTAGLLVVRAQENEDD